jgi:hypothetical protein
MLDILADDKMRAHRILADYFVLRHVFSTAPVCQLAKLALKNARGLQLATSRRRSCIDSAPVDAGGRGAPRNSILTHRALDGATVRGASAGTRASESLGARTSPAGRLRGIPYWRKEIVAVYASVTHTVARRETYVSVGLPNWQWRPDPRSS